MAWPNQESVETFMRITGASESIALRKLEEYRGNLNAAVNSHFSEGYSFNQYVAPTFPEQNYTNVNGGSQGGQYRLLPILNAARSFRPSNLLDPNYRSHLFDRMRSYPSVGSPSRNSHLQPRSMGPIPSGFNSFPAQPSHQAWRGTFEDENHISSSSNQKIENDTEDEMLRAAIEASKHTSSSSNQKTENDTEDEMLRAAIEASKHTSSSSNQKTENNTEDEMLRAAIEASKQNSDLEFLQRQLQREEDDLARAVSLSLSIAEQEKAVRELMPENKDEVSSIERGESSISGPKDCRGSTSTHHRHKQDASHPNEWGSITSKELSESVLLEAALFGGGSSDDFSENSLPASHLQNVKIQGTSKGSDLQPVPSSSAQQSQQQQQDTGRNLAAQKTPFPPEPEINNKDSVTLLLRMPDGCRLERRFLNSDKLQLLLNFIDDEVAMKPGTYKVTRPYPRRAFGVEDGSMMLRDLGLTGKQEALVVELI